MTITGWADKWMEFGMVGRAAEAVHSQESGWFLRASQAKTLNLRYTSKNAYISLPVQSTELDVCAVNTAIRWWDVKLDDAQVPCDLATCIVSALPATVQAGMKIGASLSISLYLYLSLCLSWNNLRAVVACGACPTICVMIFLLHLVL